MEAVVCAVLSVAGGGEKVNCVCLVVLQPVRAGIPTQLLLRSTRQCVSVSGSTSTSKVEGFVPVEIESSLVSTRQPATLIILAKHCRGNSFLSAIKTKSQTAVSIN
jgi:hypothetical protein